MFCSKCGAEINENAMFCGNCGNKKNKEQKPPKKHFYFDKEFDSKVLLGKIKKYFSNFYVDYNSKTFKFALILFLAIEIGERVYSLSVNILPFKIYDLFPMANTVFEFLICAVIFGISAIPILKSKRKEKIKKSYVITTFWIIALVLNTIVFFLDTAISKFILYPRIAILIVGMLAVVSTALLLLKNKPKYPIALFLSALSFAFSQSSLNSIDISLFYYKLHNNAEGLLSVFSSLSNIFLIVILFVLVYLFPKKISKWAVWLPSLFAIVLRFIDMVYEFEFEDILYFVFGVCTVAAFALFALSCSREIEYDYIIENNAKTQKTAVKVGIISISSVAVIVFAYLLVSAVVCGTQINRGIEKWRDTIVNGQMMNSEQWSEMEADIFKYSSTEFASQFVDDYSLYNTLKEKQYTMENISICYSDYLRNSVDDDIVKKFSYIVVNESWSDDPILSVYYEQTQRCNQKLKMFL